MNNTQVKLETARLIIQTAALSFDEKVISYLNANRNFFEPWIPKVSADYYTIKKQWEMLKEDISLLEKEKQIRFFVFRKEDPNSIIGDFTFSNIIRGPMQSCFLGYKLAQAENNKGYMTEALRAGVVFAFENLRLHRIEANIITRNLPSIRVIEKLGFEKEGVSKKYLEINGEWEDHFRYAKLNENSN